MKTGNLQETILLDPMFEIPGSDISTVQISEEVVMGKQEAVYARVAGAKAVHITKDSQETEYNGSARAVNN